MQVVYVCCAGLDVHKETVSVSGGAKIDQAAE
jgi:hypothetical protein